MSDIHAPSLVCEHLPGDHTVSLGQLARACDMHAEWIIELVEHGVIEPAARHRGPQDVTVWYFSTTHLVRARRAARLHRDLAVNTPGLALALELMDEITTLRAELDATRERTPPASARD
ncbi:chaperone modulator CbpM [Salinisphaera sp. Q1T1-3]|uniref:chaperone modulator CbpM n=1 Tax=Salinisphaera sp. Q1T1-3 TaxID=2321229 RepID=UPI000E738619|nr:chaperone modulator CbpM [Salinisphaera sp. Q1T1-3]RJS93723.1 MerR family transcriptional regulator [Salinisphaera sp. Q1T1-3]